MGATAVVTESVLEAMLSDPRTERLRLPRNRPRPYDRWTGEQLRRNAQEFAELKGWAYHHDLPTKTKTGQHKTIYDGQYGFTDTLFVRMGVVIAAEFKGPKEKATPEQLWWLRQWGQFGRLWRPQDWPAIVTELSAPIGQAGG